MRLCIHQMPTGLLCRSPALRDNVRCFHHLRAFNRQLTRAKQHRNLPMHTPPHRIRSLNRIIQALVARQLQLSIARGKLTEIAASTHP